MTTALATFIACQNDGNLAGMAAFWPDAYLRELLGSIVYGWARVMARGAAVDPATIDPAQTRDLVQRFLASDAASVPATRQTLVAVTDMQDLGDGVITATMLLGAGAAAPVAFSVSLVWSGDGWQLQNLPYPLPAATPTP